MTIRYVRIALACVALALGASALPAAADIPVGGATVNDVSSLLQDLGYTTTLGTDSTGDPMVKFSIGNTNTEVWFYDCSSDAVKRCQSIQLVAGFALRTNPTYEVMNNWDRDKRFGRGYIGTKGVFIEVDIDIAAGASKADINNYLSRFKTLIPLFRKYIGYDT